MHYSTDGGSSYTSTDTTSTNFSISNNSLNANTNAVKLTFSSQSNQIGIESCTIKVREIIYNSNPLCNSATITYDANGATTGTVPTDPNSPYPLVNGQKDINLLYNTGNLAKTGYTFDGWNTEFDGSGTSYSEGATFTLTDNIVLYAKWNPNNYTIRWRVNGLSDGDHPYPYNTLIPDGDVPSDESTLEYVCDDKTFVGWSETASELFDGVPTLLQRNQIVNTAVTGNKTYYAVFADVSETAVKWNLVTDEDDLAVGDSVVIVASEYNYAMSKTQNSNNRGQVGITKSGSEITLNSNVCVFVIQNGLDDIGTLAFYDANYNDGNGGYLYAASSGSNYLRTEDELDIDGNGNWAISIDEGTGVATITAQGSNSRNLLRYNNSSSIFSCYGSGQKDVSIYKKTGGTSYSNYTTFCPCAYGIDGISNGDMVWAGKNGPTNDWNLASNWVVYRSSDHEYHLASEAPSTENNVFVVQKGECGITVSPNISENITCGNLTMFNGLSLAIAENKNLTINGTATFTNGIINGNVTFGSNATISGVSRSSHVDGIVTKSGAANSTGFYFPTGSNGNLGKVVVTDGSATNVSVQYFSNSEGFGANDLPRWWNAADMSGENPFNHVSNVEYWRISSNEAITANFVAVASAGMQHFNSETAEEDKIPTNIQMAFYDNKRWTNVGGSAFINDSTLTITGAEIPASATRGISGNYTTFGSKSKSTVLPIELLSFTANCNGKSSLIEWTTATEKNNDFFVLERSNDAINFKEIARVAGAGNSIEPINYAYTDYGARSGDNYYRLVQVDYDGTSTTSEIIVANCPAETSGKPDVLAFPNPFDDNLTLHFENFGNVQATVEVYDMLGRMVQTQMVNCSQNDYEVVLRLAGLSEGTYNVRISTKEFVLNKKVVKQ